MTVRSYPAALGCVLALGCGNRSVAQPEDAGRAPRDAATASHDSRAPVAFDLGRDFSFTANPNGPWRYGYSVENRLSVAAFKVDALAVEAGPMSIWHPSAEAGGYYPYIAKSHADISIMDATSSWALRSDQVALEASPNGQLSVIAFDVPSAGDYEITALFEGVHFRLSTTDVHVQLNDEPLFTAEIDGYAGDSAFAAEQGERPRAIYEGRLALKAQDQLSFAVGNGSNRTNTNDTTGLTLRIRQLP